MLGPKPAQTSGCSTLAVRTCSQGVSLALSPSVSWFCLHPSPGNSQQSSGLGWGLIVLLGHILASFPQKRNLFLPGPLASKGMRHPDRGEVRHPSRFQRAKVAFGGKSSYFLSEIATLTLHIRNVKALTNLASSLYWH